MRSMEERKLARLSAAPGHQISAGMYNFLIGICLLYGFVMNAVIVSTCGSLFLTMKPGVLLVGYVISAFAGILLSLSAKPVVSFIGYNLVVIPIGAVLCVSLPAYGQGAILSAIIITGAVTLLMLAASTAYPNLFVRMGRTLFIVLIFGIIAEIIAFLLGYGGDLFHWAFVILFSLYIGYDWCKSQQYPKTVDNAVDSALDLYLDIINLFLRLLRILNHSRD